MPLGSLPRAAVVPLMLGLTVVGLGACESGPSSSERAPTSSSAPYTPPVSESATKPSSSVQKPSALGQARLDQQLRDAAWKNDVKAAEALIDRGADVNATDSTAQSAYPGSSARALPRRR